MATLVLGMSILGWSVAALQLVLYGPLSGADESSGRPPRGDRVAARLRRMGEALDTLRQSRYFRWFRLGRNIVVIVLGLIFVVAVGEFIWLAFISDPTSSSGEAESLGEAIGQAFGEAILYLFVLALLLGIAILAVLGWVAVFLLQWALFGLRGRRAAITVTLEAMGRRPRRILGVSAAAASGFSILEGLLLAT